MIAFSLLALALLAAALILIVQARRIRSQTGLPSGEIVYDDSGARHEVEKPLLSRRHGLVGRPDYLVRGPSGKELIPVEVKSAQAPHHPHASHIVQLGAYCLLVEDNFHRRPSYGLLRYADATFKIPYTDQLRRQVLDTAAAIRRARTATTVARNHSVPQRCHACGYAHACDERLT